MLWAVLLEAHKIRVARGDWPVTLGCMFLPLIPTFTFHARKLRKVLAAGYSLPDVQHAVKVWQAEKREELAFESDGALPRSFQILRAATLGFAALFLLLVTGVIEPNIPYVMWRWIPIGVSAHLLRQFITAGTGLLAGITAIASHALGVPFLPREMKRSLTGGVRSWFWNSRAGALAIGSE